MDFERLRDKRLAVIGVGASAMDNAAAALESGATRLDIFIRHPNIPRINKFTGLGSQGTVHSFAGLPDDWKWRFLDLATKEQTPHHPSTACCVSPHIRTHTHLASPIDDLVAVGDHLIPTTPKSRYETDFIIFGSCFKVDLTLRPELSEHRATENGSGCLAARDT